MSAAGWAFPTRTARKAHYFPADTERSLCGNYARFLLPDEAFEPDDRATSSDCVGCRRKKSAPDSQPTDSAPRVMQDVPHEMWAWNCTLPNEVRPNGDGRDAYATCHACPEPTDSEGSR